MRSATGVGVFDDEDFGDVTFLTHQLVQEAVAFVAHAGLMPGSGRETFWTVEQPVTASAHTISVPQTQARRFMKASVGLGSCVR